MKREVMKKKIIIILIMIILIVIGITWKFVADNRKKNFYDNLKKKMQDDIKRVLYTIYPHCEVGYVVPDLVFEESQNNYYGVDKKKLLDIDSKSYCKIKVKTKCVENSKLNWTTYIRCKDYEDEGFN